MHRPSRTPVTLCAVMMLLVPLLAGLLVGSAPTQAASIGAASASAAAVEAIDAPGHHFGFTQASVLAQTTTQQTLTAVAATATRQAAITQPITGALAQSALTAAGFTASSLQSCVGFGSGANIGGSAGIGFNPAGPIGGPGFGNPVGPIGGFGASNFGVGGGVGGNAGATCQVTGGLTGTATITGSATWSLTVAAAPANSVAGSIPAAFALTTAISTGFGEGPFPCTALAAAGGTTTCNFTTVGNPLVGNSVAVCFATPGVGTGITCVTGSVAQSGLQNPIILPILPPPPPPPPPPLPPPPLLPPPPPAGVGIARPAFPEVPVIPEADSILLLAGGLAALGALAGYRRWRGRKD